MTVSSSRPNPLTARSHAEKRASPARITTRPDAKRRVHRAATSVERAPVGWSLILSLVMGPGGKIMKVHRKDVDYKGYTHHASKDDPQYEIKSDKTDHIAMHKGPALKKASG